MNDDDIRNLRELGGRVGTASLNQWQQLLTAVGIEKVRFAIAQVKISSRQSQVTAEETAAHLKVKLKDAPAAAIAKPPVPATVERPKALVEQKLDNQDELDDEAAGTERDDQVEKKSTRRKDTDYLAIIDRLGSPYATEVAVAAGVTSQSACQWIRKHLELLVVVPAGRFPRYRVRRPESPPATPPEVAPERESERKELLASIDELVDDVAAEKPLEAAPEKRQTPYEVCRDIGRVINPPIVMPMSLEPGSVSHAYSQPAKEPGPELAFTVTDDELDGDLIDIVSRLIDVYADRHGFASTYKQTHRVLRFLTPEAVG